MTIHTKGFIVRMPKISALETPKSHGASDSTAMLIALGIVAYAASMITHEALGHGLHCIAAGGKNLFLGSLGERCSIQARGIEATGPVVQFASGLAAWFALRSLRPRFPIVRHFLWLYMAFCLLISSGYVAFSGVADFGDAAVLIEGLQPHFVWRGALVLFGGLIYFRSMRVAAIELGCGGVDDGELGRVRRLVWIPYISAGVLACCASALNRMMPPGLSFGLAVASSFGAGFGMVAILRLRHRIAKKELQPAGYIRWSLPWAVFGTAVAAAFVFLLGPGIP